MESLTSTTRNLLGSVALAFALVPMAGAADELPAPEGDVILTVSGAISVTNVDDTAQFDIEMLRAIDETTFDTTTIWTDGVQTFTGVELYSLIETLGVESGTLKATAINDYSINFPVREITKGGAIIAYENGGEPMSIRSKGPLWIVFPFDSNEAFQTEVSYSRSIWQLERIEVLE